MTPFSQQKLRTSVRLIDAFRAQDDSDPAVPSISQQRLAWLMRISRTSCTEVAPETAVNAERRHKRLGCPCG